MQALLGRTTARSTPKLTLLTLHDAAGEGFAASVVDALTASLATSRSTVQEILSLSARTYARRLASGRLSAEESDRALRLARVAAYAEEVLGGREAGIAWLHAPNRELGGRSPLALLRSDAGATLATDVLTRLEHGVFG